MHMMLGVVGPVLVLFHADFHLGATNSNVALICMLLVAGSGVIGRYIYTRIHAQSARHRSDLQELRAVAERMRSQTTTMAFLPELMEAIEREERRLFRPDAGPLRPAAACRSPPCRALRWRAGGCTARSASAVEQAANRESAHHRAACAAASSVARDYVDRRLDAAAACGGVRLLRAAVLVVARAAHTAVLHAADCRHRARDRGQRVLTLGHAQARDGQAAASRQ